MGRGSVAGAWLTFLTLLGVVAHASEQAHLKVGHKGDTYTIHTMVVLPADASHVRAILASPGLLRELNDRIRSVETLPSDAGESTLRIASRRCVLLVCRDYTWVQTVWVDRAGDVRVRFEPDGEPESASSVNDGEILYRIDPVSPGRARVEVSARIVPAVELPPLIGPALMRSTLSDDMTVWSANIARLSRETAAGDRVVVARSAPRRPAEAPR